MKSKIALGSTLLALMVVPAFAAIDSTPHGKLVARSSWSAKA